VSKVCESTGKKPRSGGYKYVRSGLPKKKGGVGLKVRGKTLRWWRPNIQSVRVLLPNGEVRRMNLSATAIKKGQIQVKMDGRMQTIPLVKAARGRQKLWKQQAEAEQEA
jgi:large subunit ribosomal protein L28